MRAAHSGQTSPGPQCRAQKPTLQSNLSDKLFPCSFPSAPWWDMEVGLPAQGASQHAVSPVFTSRMQEDTTQGWISQAVSMARARLAGQGSCHHRASPGCLSDKSASQQLICSQSLSNPALPSPIKTSMWGSGRWTQSRCTHRCGATSAPQDSAYCDKHCEKDRTFTSQGNGMSLHDRHSQIH